MKTLYRNSKNGYLMSKEQFDKADPDTTTKETVKDWPELKSDWFVSDITAIFKTFEEVRTDITDVERHDIELLKSLLPKG